jgi:hypothetical protein
MKKDLLSMPADAFFYYRLTPRQRIRSQDRKPYSLILSQATTNDFKELYENTSSFYSCDDIDFIHFSLFDCCDQKDKFVDSQVLTVNTETENYKWRKPYNKRTLPK